MRRPIALLCLFFVAAVLAAAQPPTASSLSNEELREFVAIFAEVRANAAGFPSAPVPQARRSSVEIIEAHGWTLEQYNRAAHAINSDRDLFLHMQSMLDED